jgi:hypothetical protein
VTAPVDLGRDLLAHLRGQGRRSAAALLELAIDSAHADYRRAVCGTIARELVREAETQHRLAGVFARARRPRLRRTAAGQVETLLGLAQALEAFAADDVARAEGALARMAAA